MRTMETDDKNNLIVKGDFAIIDGQESIKQDIKHRLLMWKTENPFNINEGIAWYDLANANDKNAIKIAIKKRILEDERVKAILSLDIVNVKGDCQIIASLNTTEGIVNV